MSHKHSLGADEQNIEKFSFKFIQKKYFCVAHGQFYAPSALPVFDFDK
jgi:hypothetical protein